MKKITLDEILEEVFGRGFNHGLSKGLSEDGEFYAIRDAKKALKKFYRKKK